MWIFLKSIIIEKKNFGSKKRKYPFEELFQTITNFFKKKRIKLDF